MKCKYCKQKIINKNKKYCNRICYHKSKDFKKIQSKGGKSNSFENHSKAGKIGGHNCQKILRKSKIGIYRLTFEQHSKMGKNGAKTNRKNKTGFFNSKLQHELGQRGIEVNRKNRTGMYFDKKVQTEGGLAAQHTLRMNHRNLKYKNLYYDSKYEIEISLCLQEQFNYIPKEDETLHIQIGKYEYDFKMEYLKLFIEFHQWFINETEKEYHYRRRENLDLNNYKNYNLIIIK